MCHLVIDKEIQGKVGCEHQTKLLCTLFFLLHRVPVLFTDKTLWGTAGNWVSTSITIITSAEPLAGGDTNTSAKLWPCRTIRPPQNLRPMPMQGMERCLCCKAKSKSVEVRGWRVHMQGVQFTGRRLEFESCHRPAIYVTTACPKLN